MQIVIGAEIAPVMQAIRAQAGRQIVMLASPSE